MIKTKEVIKTHKEEVEIWNDFKNYNSEIITYLYKYTYNFLGIRWTKYKIKQDIPYISRPYWPSEHSCNKRLTGIAEYNYNKMKLIKEEYENERIQGAPRSL